MKQHDLINKCVDQCNQWCAEDSESDFLAIDLFDYMNALVLAEVRKKYIADSTSWDLKLQYYAQLVVDCKEFFPEEYIEECIPISITPEVHDVPWERGSASGIHSFGTEYHGVYEAVVKCYNLLMEFYADNYLTEDVIEEMERV
jgi:hypothetical protein